MAFYYLGNPSVRYYYGVYGSSCSINRGGGTSSSGFAVWSQQPESGTKYNKSIRFDNGLPVSSTIRTLSTNGKYIQVGNGATSNHSNMYVSSFYPNTLPYYFSTSATLAPLSKTSSDLVEGRGVLVNIGDATFTFCLEGLNVDGQNIPFIEIPDTCDYSAIDNLNNSLLTKPFKLDTDSRIIFTEISGFTDSALACKALGQGEYIRYKIELIDDASGKVLGTVKNVNLTASNVHAKKTPTYALDARGYDKRTVRARVTFETNLADAESKKRASNTDVPSHIPDEIKTRRLNAKIPNIILMKSYSEENVSLAKSTVSQLKLEAPDIPAVYALKNCYPNPFNPTTTLTFDLPEEARVEIIVYDLMGREVWKSTKTHYSAGTYSVVWNGTNHSGQPVGTGMYLVRLNSANYNATQKVLLVK
ncbi:MAG TPA: T9SS type A sorting domain-containing protein, partial [Candidatus Marinimicrobia bacterium]|nr:T9SS type A sorting domain-containing protein [Candidatus Neomarinimicrobiota bacterium]